MTLKDILGENYKEEATKEELIAAIEKLNLLNADSEDFKGRYTDKTEYDKLKAAFDKTASVLATEKKEKQGTLTEAQQLRAELEELKKRNEMTDFERQLSKGGFSDEALADIMTAYGTKELADKVSLHTKKMLEETKKNIQAEALKNFKSPPPAQNGGDGITKEKFDKMGYADRLKIYETQPEVYKQFTSQ